MERGFAFIVFNDGSSALYINYLTYFSGVSLLNGSLIVMSILYDLYFPSFLAS